MRERYLHDNTFSLVSQGLVVIACCKTSALCNQSPSSCAILFAVIVRRRMYLYNAPAPIAAISEIAETGAQVKKEIVRVVFDFDFMIGDA